MKPYYQDSLVTIYHGNCKDIIPQLDTKADLLLTDPPYGSKQNLQQASSKRDGNLLGGLLTKSKDWQNCYGDDIDFDPSHIIGFPKVIIWGANYFHSRLPNCSKWLIWDKRGSSTPDDNADCELAWTNLKGVSRIYRQLWRGICRQGRENIAIQGNKLHPFQKPVALMKWCINEAGLVKVAIDPYMGSGSTVVACKELNVYCVGIEINEELCEISASRYQQSATGLNI